MRRSRLSREEVDRRHGVKAAVHARDGWRCQFPHDLWPYKLPCSRWLTVHHLRKATAGGAYVEGNLLSMCSYGNDAIEDRPDRARELGLSVSREVDSLEAQRRRMKWGSTW